MTTVRVKICGITRKEDLFAATDAGADAIGFVLDVPFSPRNLSLNEAEKLIPRTPPFVKSILVTVPRDIEELEKICDRLNPDAVQIHGENFSDDRDILERLYGTVIIREVKANPKEAMAKALKASRIFNAILLDSFVQGKDGGTGVIHDWRLSREIRLNIKPKPLILAGGLDPENVSEAVRTVQPYGVDVSSGVEKQPGIKSKEKLISFIKNAKDVEI